MTDQRNEVAVVGYACRLPSAPDASEFWSVLMQGRCVVSEIPADRFPRDRAFHPDKSVPGKSYTFKAGIIDDAFDFDPGFFGISPREAVQMDPQQRLLLQVTHEALEQAGLKPSSLARSQTGVFVGASSWDYSTRFNTDLSAIDAQMMTGNTLSIVSNRISYIFDLRGPSFTVDTACSSSLVALHEAVEAIAAGRIDTAIVGGVNMLGSVGPFIGFARASMLSPSGLCRAFDAAGDGYLRAEGAVTLVLKSAARARADRDHIHAVIVGTGINADGRTIGLSLPSSEAQGALLADVYQRAGVDPAALAFIEAHGTGTRVGDPAEASALGRVLGSRRQAPLPIGSVKTNIGHLEPASGLAGMLKAILALDHGILPPSLHFDTPNPDIAFDALNLTVANRAVAIPRTEAPRFAGVNSFGFGGANAHVVLREGDRVIPPQARALPQALPPLVISAQSREALEEMVRRYRDRLQGADASEIAPILNAAALTRDLHKYRLVDTAQDRTGLLTDLDSWLNGSPSETIVETRSGLRDGKIAFVFSGNGSQWAGMGQAIYRANEDFRGSFDRVDRLFMSRAGWSLLKALFSADLDIELERTEVAQPLLFAVQVALVEALSRAGVEPDFVVGHSVGEVAAAWAAGCLDLADAVTVIHARSTHQEMTRHLGGMAALPMAPSDATRAILDSGLSGIDIAAYNSPRGVTISGPTEALDQFLKAARKKRQAFKRLDLDYPFHCALVDPIRDPLIAALAGIAPRAGSTPFISTVSGQPTSGSGLDASYWWDNVRKPVLFAQAIDETARLGADVFIEIGPRSVLNGYVADIVKEARREIAILASLDRADIDTRDPVRRIAAQCLAAGVKFDGDRLFGPAQRPPAALPAYAWNNQPYVLDLGQEATATFRPTIHPLIGLPAQVGAPIFVQHLDIASLPWLADHRVGGSVVVPAAGLAEMALAAGRAVIGTDTLELRDFDIVRALVIGDDDVREVTVRVGADHDVTILSRPRQSGDDWSLHARGFLTQAPVAGEAPPAALATPDRIVDAAHLYRLTQDFGLGYGPAFKRAVSVAIAGATADVVLSETAVGIDATGYLLHPTIMDAAFHGLFTLLPEPAQGAARVTFLPTRFGALRLYAAGAPIARCRIDVTRRTARSVEARFLFLDPTGTVVARLEGARFSAVKLAQRASLDDFIYRTVAVALPGFGATSPVATIWSDGPARAASGLGLTVAREAHDPDEGRLLTDASIAYLAADVVSRLVGAWETGFTIGGLVTEGRLAAASRPLFARLMSLLSDDGLATLTDGVWRLAPDSDVQPVDLMLRTLLADHPDFIAEATLICELARALPVRLGQATDGVIGSEATRDHFDTASPTARPLAEAIAALVRDLAGRAADDSAIRLLVIGADNQRLVAEILAVASPTTTSVILTDPDASVLERCRLSFGQRNGLAYRSWSDLDVGFDLILGVDVARRWTDPRATLSGLAVLLSPGGALALTEPAPTGFIDLLRGISADWWRGTRDPDQPRGAMPSAQGWLDLLRQTTLVEADVATLAASTCHGLLITARARVAEPVPMQPHVSSVPAIIVADGKGRGRALCDALTAQLNHGRRPVRLLLDEVGDDKPDGSVAHEIHLVTFDGAPTSDARLAAALPDGDLEVLFCFGAHRNCADPMKDALARTAAFASLVRAIGPRPARVWVVAPGANQTVPGAHGTHAARALGRPGQAAPWGFARTAANEAPHLDIRLVDPAPTLEPGEVAIRLATLIAHPGDEREIVLDADHSAALRILPGGLLRGGTSAVTGPATRQLDIETQGSLDRLTWSRVARRTPAAGEIEIAVVATGLNFRDVMWAMGLLPAEALEDGFAGPTLGMECSGIVTAVGDGVSGFAVGQPCVAFAAAAFAGHVTVPAHAVALLPASLPLEAAATIPVAFLTAWYALVHLARIDEGETLLVHGGAGGVGLAALQIAKLKGASVIATAGTDEKRALLTMLGADHVLDSRSLGFADAVMRLTGGAGVDVVLNSLAGEAMERSLGCLKPFGRFLELGKRDFYGNTRLGLRPFRQNLSYFGIDADQLLTRQLKLAQRLFRDLIAHFDDGTLTPLPYRAFAADEVTPAFRLMQQAGHIGKIVIRAPALAGVDAAEPHRFIIDPQACYLIVGGTGGFGLQLARRLAQRGARHLFVASRSGTIAADHAETVAEIAALGATLTAERLDATDATAVARLMERLATGAQPLKGVFLTAMVLDDGLIAGLTPERIAAVLAPKVAAAAILDAATRRFPLDCFVLFSSATTLIGNPGQAHYVAANAYLEALARQRRQEGLPALAVAWGAISDAGYLARNSSVSDVLSRRLGRSSLTAQEALDGLEAMMALDAHDPALASIGFARIDWAQAASELALIRTPLFANLADRLAAQTAPEGDGALSDELAGLDAGQALDRVARLIAIEIERILRIPAAEIDRRRPLTEIGMDSLMALELRMAAEERLGVEIPLMSLAGGATLDDIATRALQRLRHGAADTDLSAEAEAIARSHLGDSASAADLAALAQAADTIDDGGRRVF